MCPCSHAVMYQGQVQQSVVFEFAQLHPGETLASAEHAAGTAPSRVNTCLQRPADPVHWEKKPSILGFQCYVPSQATLLPQFHQKPANCNPPTPMSAANFRSLKGQGPYLPWHLRTEPFKVQGRASASPGSSLWLTLSRMEF